MLRFRSLGLVGLMMSLVVAGLVVFVVRPAIYDTTDRALDTANRVIDTAAQQSADIRDTVNQATSDLDEVTASIDAATDATDAVDAGDYLSAAAFAAIVGDLKSEIGAKGELLDLTVHPNGGNVKFRTGDRAAGFEWGTGIDGLAPVEVTLVGSGKLEDNVFPIAELQPGATEKLAAAVKAEAGDDFEIQAMTLGLNPVTGAVRWSVSGEGDGRAQVYTAKPDASGLRKIG